MSTTISVIREETFERVGAPAIFVRSWRPATRANGVIVIVPGFNSHGGYYDWTAQQLSATGLVVYAVDLRGRGKSGGERFFVNRFTDYLIDVESVFTAAKLRDPGLPVFLFGHSAGGVIGCEFALKHQPELAGLICESFAFHLPAPRFALSLLRLLSHIAPHQRVLRLQNEDFSRDPDVVRFMNNDPLIAQETQPMQTIAELARAGQRLQRGLRNLKLPVLILHGTADKATRPSGSEYFFNIARSSEKSLKLYPDHYHDLLNDVGKEEVIQDVIGWITTQLR
jgi:acylglycerol lipase